MSSNKDSIFRVLITTISLCVVASFFVSVAAVYLKDLQEFNKLNEKKINILQAAGFVQAGEKVSPEQVEKYFEKIRISIVDFETGKIVDGDLEKFDQLKLSKNPKESIILNKKADIAGLKHRENKGLIYEVIEDGNIKTIIIPIRGYGLWSTLFGFLALSSDGKNIKGITFYQHGETPGLGGEVDNVRWKAKWINKKAYDDSGNISIKVVRGQAAEGSLSDVDGISGATLTSRGVEFMLHFWLSDMGYKKYLINFFN